MLKLSHVTIRDLQDRCIVNDLSFTIHAYDKVAVIGEEGNGKSTLLKAMLSDDSIASYASISGKIEMDFKKCGYLPQQMDTKWYSYTCMEYLMEEDVAAYEIKIACKKLNISWEMLDSCQRIQTLSGGEKVKIQLLKLYLQQCEILFLDEPTNDLDIHAIEWLEQFLDSLEIPVVFVTHDESLLSNCANRILHLEQRNKKMKSVVNDFYGTYEEYLRARQTARNKEVKTAKKEKQEFLKKQKKLNDIRNAVHHAQNKVSRQAPHTAKMLKRKMHAVKAMEQRLEQVSLTKVDQVEEAIDLRFELVYGIHKKVVLEHEFSISVGSRVLLKPQMLSIHARDKIAITGKNGCGKSMLMKEIYAYLKDRSDLRIGYMPQNYGEQMDMDKNAISFLLDSKDKNDVSRSRELLGRIAFTRDEMEKPIHQLSEGSKAKLYLLKFIKQSAQVLLLDEPTRNLSPLSAAVIRTILASYDGCIIAVSHDRMFLCETVNEVWVMENQMLVTTDK